MYVCCCSKLEMARLEEYLGALEAAHNLGSLDDAEFEAVSRQRRGEAWHGMHHSRKLAWLKCASMLALRLHCLLKAPATLTLSVPPTRCAVLSWQARDVHWLAGMQAGGAGVAALGGAFEAAVEAAVGDDGLPIEPEVRQQHPNAARCLPSCTPACAPASPSLVPLPAQRPNLLSYTLLSLCSTFPRCPTLCRRM